LLATQAAKIKYLQIDRRKEWQGIPKYLLKNKHKKQHKPTNSYGYTPLHNAASQYHLDLQKPYRNPIHCAADVGNLE
jgi:hypothetical protein